MSTEHEGDRQESAGPAPAASPAADAEPTVVQPAAPPAPTVEPPADPTLADFPPPVPAAPATPPAAPPPAPVPSAPEQPYAAPEQPYAAPVTADTAVHGAYATTAMPQQHPDAPSAPPQPTVVYGAPVPPPPAAPPGQPPYHNGPLWGAGVPVDQPKPRKKRRGGFIALLAATAVIAGAIGGAIGSAIEDQDSGSSGSSTSTVITPTTDPNAQSRPAGSIAAIAARALPSVVTIEASGSSESGTGTGFVYDTEGHILTNNHVVAPSVNGGKLTVKFSDGSSYPASIVGRAQGYDVAVIKLTQTPREKLTPLPLGDSDKVAVGDATIAIGAPFGLSGTVTSGIISAKNRPVASGDETGAQTSYMNALQTDASINPGNSGGPLMNASGQVIGIDSAIQSTGSNVGGGQSGSIGLGFAIPINQAKRVAEQLIRTGTPIYPIIGILRDDSYTGDGAKIASGPVQGTPAVTPGGPADQAGLKPGDIITKFDGVIIDSGPTLVSEIWSHQPGDKVAVTYTRNGQTHETTLTLGSRKGDQ